ncbi:hypothetical protein M409DRAFT_19942 [Zasmidium cellare ATCC 36951]|uniref:SnoaL-like domain-containing protein n=1 Tax=Zasmidium cellare ATCC 36951 TaxID=1080233 RepID=A0A6A6CUP5_ZASCE|nr:uncharacterized protein M409DRAFT_19942 [Zasmidium cellare ATCC 36951]KAF2169529.1 hypothetical protein M409DRAFT_19942 [Zasmidium cellare ATCC 36951]
MSSSSSNSSSSTSSLALLLPPASTNENNSPSYPTDQKFAQTPATSELETLTRTVIDAINARSYQPIHNLVASTYKADLDDISRSDSYDQDVTQLWNLSSDNPGYRVEVMEVEADVDERGGYAIVYCLLSVTGRPANIRRQSVSIVEWMRRNGQWQFYKATLMRGLDGTEIAHPGCRRCAHKKPRRNSAVNTT